MLLNVGGDDTFRIPVDKDVPSDTQMGYFWHMVAPENVSAIQNVPAEISIQIFLDNFAPVGWSVTFTIVLQSTSSFDTNDFISFDAVNVQEVSQ